ncbi:MAG TPA: hypothetical protein PKN54_00470 [Candidatus Cloacimonas acidaminovorans]|nr:hypothetical protein [Candidatus Cloacimonas acidaminovorans]
MYKKQNWRIIKAVLKSLKAGASIETACNKANVSFVTFWRWRKENKRLDNITKAIYDSRICIVEDALYRDAVAGNTTAQIFFLKNRDVNRWRDRHELDVSSEEEHHIVIIRPPAMIEDKSIKDVGAFLERDNP